MVVSVCRALNNRLSFPYIKKNGEESFAHPTSPITLFHDKCLPFPIFPLSISIRLSADSTVCTLHSALPLAYVRNGAQVSANAGVKANFAFTPAFSRAPGLLSRLDESTSVVLHSWPGKMVYYKMNSQLCFPCPHLSFIDSNARLRSQVTGMTPKPFFAQRISTLFITTKFPARSHTRLGAPTSSNEVRYRLTSANSDSYFVQSLFYPSSSHCLETATKDPDLML